MNRLILGIILCLIPLAAFGARVGGLQQDVTTNVVQGPAPNGTLSQILTVASTTVDATGSIWWGLYAPADCKYRLMPTSAKASYPQHTAPGGSLTGRVVNSATPFVNFSGCTGGELQRQ